MKTKKCWFSSALFLKSEYYSYIIFWYFWVRSWQPKRKKNWTIQKLKRWKRIEICSFLSSYHWSWLQKRQRRKDKNYFPSNTSLFFRSSLLYPTFLFSGHAKKTACYKNWNCPVLISACYKNWNCPFLCLPG